jgi:hypothetical protein
MAFMWFSSNLYCFRKYLLSKKRGVEHPRMRNEIHRTCSHEGVLAPQNVD